ncbi:NADPH-dependent FMN reductase [Microbacterium sp.]|uniref:NADPH-dependent FMN reductase n=1 Tax=Microbacterium sp. TaxID=51671 RepID=UPI003F6F8080
MPTIEVLVGNPQRGSRTRLVAEEVAGQLAARSGAAIAETIDLADAADQLFVFPSPDIDVLLARVASADLLVVASPTYKAAYTGLLKSFLDRYPTAGLSAVTAVPILTIGAPTHALAVELTLRPLLVELGASVPTRGIAFPAGEADRRTEIVTAWLDGEWSRLAPVLRESIDG